jgi:glucosyl-3-phosphoglycerate synthase
LDIEQGRITRIHDYAMDFNYLKSRMTDLREKVPSGVIIPVIESDLDSPAIDKIIDGLNHCDYLKKIFIALSSTAAEGYDKAAKSFSKLEVPHEILWCNNQKVKDLLGELRKKGLDVTKMRGKGKDLWIALGVASLELDAIAIHDADITTYSEFLPTKLLYSIVEPRLDFWFAKGYYARINLDRRRIYGRVYRLFINPLLAAIQKKLAQSSSFIHYLQSFRYPLSGEMAITTDIALNLRIPSDWGLEIGILAELYRNASNKRICEVDLGFFDHKHKPINPKELLYTGEASLITLLRTLTETEAIDISEASLLSLQVTYRRFAQDRIRQYYADAICNNLEYNRHSEETAVEALSKTIMTAGKRYIKNPTSAQMPDWLRTISAISDARERMRDAANLK